MTDHPRRAEEVGRALEAHAQAVVPSPPPTRAIIDAARKRKARGRAGGLAACGAAFLAAAMFVSGPGETSSPPAGPAAPPDAPTRSTVRTVLPGEKVTVSPGRTIWLTEDGRQCDQLRHSAPSCAVLTTQEPSVGLVFGTASGDRKRWVGHFTAPGAALVVVHDGTGKHMAALVTLAGKPGWGAWYADMPAPSGNGSQLPRSLTVYDAAGKVLVEQKLAAS